MTRSARKLPDGLDELPSGRIRARFRCRGCEEHDGKSSLHSKSFAPNEVRLAVKWRTREKAAVDAGAFRPESAGRITFKAYAEEWMTRQSFSESTRQAVELRLRNHAYPVLGHLSLKAIQPETIQRWLRTLRREDGQALAPSYRRVIAVNVSSVFADAVDNNKLPKNPFDAQSVRKVRPKMGKPKKVVRWEAETVMAVREALPERWRIAVTLAAGLGLRQGELFGLSPDDVDFLGGTVTVRRQVKLYANGSQVFALPKGGSEEKDNDTTRMVPLPSSVREPLAAYLARFPAREVSLPWDVTEGKPVAVRLILTNREGNALNRNYWNAHIWKPALRAAGVPDTRENGMHALRHFFASALLDGGESIKAVAQYLGHSDPGFTLRTYTHLMRSSDQRTKDAVDAALGVTKPSVSWPVSRAT